MVYPRSKKLRSFRNKSSLEHELCHVSFNGSFGFTPLGWLLSRMKRKTSKAKVEKEETEVKEEKDSSAATKKKAAKAKPAKRQKRANTNQAQPLEVL